MTDGEAGRQAGIPAPTGRIGGGTRPGSEIERLRAVVDVGRALAGQLDLDPLLSLIVERTADAMGADRVSLFLIDWESRELWSKVAQGVRYEEIRFPMDRGLAGHVATTGETLNVPDAYMDGRFNPAVDRETGYRTHSVLVVPMTSHGGERIGVLQALNRQDGAPFDPHDEELMHSLAGQAAVAVENARLYEEQKATFLSFVEALAAATDARDPITAGHSRRVTAYTLAIAESLGQADDALETLRVAALLHDIGKIGVPEKVLFKDGRLTSEEYEVIKSHARHTLEILGKIRFARDQQDIPMMAATHHERMDGGGYPLGLKGQDIPEAGRIMAVADVFDALTSRRHYRDRMDFRRVLAILDDGRGSHFQPEFVDTFLALPLDKVVAILEGAGHDPVSEEDMALFAGHTLATLGEALDAREGRDGDTGDLAERFLALYTRDLPEGYEALD